MIKYKIVVSGYDKILVNVAAYFFQIANLMHTSFIL